MQYGPFDNKAKEYVIDRVDLPVSWTNYLGTERTRAVVNHTAGGQPAPEGKEARVTVILGA